LSTAGSSKGGHSTDRGARGQDIARIGETLAKNPAPMGSAATATADDGQRDYELIGDVRESRLV
jgi:hypothetical protein